MNTKKEQRTVFKPCHQTTMVSIFVPCQILSVVKHGFLFGNIAHLDGNSFINNSVYVESNELSRSATKFWEDFNPRILESYNFIGFIYNSNKKKDNKYIFESKDYYAAAVLQFDSSSNFFNVELLEGIFFSSQNIATSQIIIYDWESITKSCIFYKNSLSDSEDIIPFLQRSLVLSGEKSYLFDDCIKVIQYINTSHTLWSLYFQLFCLFYYLFLKSRKILLRIPKWFKEISFKILTSTCTGRQFHQRLVHCEKVQVESKKNLNMQCKNIIFAVTFDVICGCLISGMFLRSNLPLLLLDTSVRHANYLVNYLQKLIYWLMGVPAGLKLNVPLNSALGHFFLYHIYLWEAYIAVILPVFSSIIKIATFIGFFGVTFILCLLNDLISIGTIHIYCFYGYATRLYGYQISALCALWRLFRGKKWNPLRERVDSYTYDNHQLFLGTLIFTVLLFLLPTVLVYYFVFTCLRLLVLIIQGIITKAVSIVNALPLYSTIAWIADSAETAGSVYFNVFNTAGTLTLSMKTSQVPLLTMIGSTTPELYKYEDCFTWTSLLSSITWGQIIYPL